MNVKIEKTGNTGSNVVDLNFYSLLTIVFVIAKLGGFIDWSWWVVLSPILVTTVIATVFLVLIAWMSTK